MHPLSWEGYGRGTNGRDPYFQSTIEDWFKERKPKRSMHCTPIPKRQKPVCKDKTREQDNVLDIVSLEAMLKDLKSTNLKLVNFVSNVKDCW